MGRIGGDGARREAKERKRDTQKMGYEEFYIYNLKSL